jgi:hypothetical protein
MHSGKSAVSGASITFLKPKVSGTEYLPPKLFPKPLVSGAVYVRQKQKVSGMLSGPQKLRIFRSDEPNKGGFSW